MKKLMMAVVMFTAVNASAASLDKVAGDVWRALSNSENFHFLDNASADVFKNLNKREYYCGSSTYMYKYWHLSADFVALKPLSTSSAVIPGGGVKLHVGELLYTIPIVKRFADSIGKSAKLIDNATLGIGITRNFDNGETIPVIYGGFVKRFK